MTTHTHDDELRQECEDWLASHTSQYFTSEADALLRLCRQQQAKGVRIVMARLLDKADFQHDDWIESKLKEIEHDVDHNKTD